MDERNTNAAAVEATASVSTPQTPQEPPAGPPAPPRKVRRVGTFTFGMVLIATGALLVAQALYPELNLVSILRLAPVVLIVLGVEVLLYAARPDVKLKYDFLSMFACAFILLVVGGASVVPQLWSYYGPAREAQNRRLVAQLESETRAALDALPGSENLIRDASFYVWDNGLTDSSITDLHQLAGEVETRASFTLTRGEGGAEAFAAACKGILDACAAAGVPIDNYHFTTRNDAVYESGVLQDFSLDVPNGWLSRADTATLAGSVRTVWWCDGCEFNTEQELLDWQAGRIAATAETAQEEIYDYDRGYQDGYAAALAETGEYTEEA